MDRVDLLASDSVLFFDVDETCGARGSGSHIGFGSKEGIQDLLTGSGQRRSPA
uniref:Uncharacterized protein n=1 Tax=Ralstonia solanacearum TaxID=305 RepID=A0A0S4XKC3_RALSL|nr:protein of unknown function [Ralstonia solanacearum]